MAQRYQLQINEQSAPAAFGHYYPSNGISVGGAALSGLGSVLGEWAKYEQKRQDEWDAASVMNAQTEFQKQMHDYLYNPETGQTVTRKLGNARDLTTDTYNYADKLAVDISSRLENDNQRAAFRNITEKLKLPYWEQASRYEVREVEQYRQQAFNSALSSAYDMSAASPDSESAREIAMAQAENAIRSYMFGSPEEAIEQTVKDAHDKIDAQRISLIAQDNPVRALEMLNEQDSNLRLSPDTRAKLIANVKPRAEIYEVQEIVDELVTQFPQDNEQEGLKFIRANYSGEREERIASAYKTRMNEIAVREDTKEINKSKEQRDYYNNVILKDYFLNGTLPSDEEVNKLVEDDVITPQMGMDIRRAKKVNATRTEFTKQLSKASDWNSLTPEQQEERVMNKMAEYSGLTNEQRQETLELLVSGVLAGEVADTQINSFYMNGVITKSEAERLKALGKQFNTAQQNFIKANRTKLTVDINNIHFQNPREARSNAIALFNEAVQELDPLSKTFRHDVMEARKNAVLQTIEDSGEPLTEKKHFWSAETPTEFGMRKSAYETSFEKELKALKEYEPVFKTDDITINNNSGKSGAPLWQSMTGARKITSRMGAARDGGTRGHKGLDIAAGKGSPIKAPQVGTELKVTKVVTNSYANDKNNKGGNSVTLEGTLSNGDKIEIISRHIQEGSINLKVGDTVQSGDVIGRVGNTGVTSGGADKNKGYHLHLEIKVNGKHVDPEKYLLPKKNREIRPAAREKRIPVSNNGDVLNVEDSDNEELDNVFSDVAKDNWRIGRTF